MSGAGSGRSGSKHVSKPAGNGAGRALPRSPARADRVNANGSRRRGRENDIVREMMSIAGVPEEFAIELLVNADWDLNKATAAFIGADISSPARPPVHSSASSALTMPAVNRGSSLAGLRKALGDISHQFPSAARPAKPATPKVEEPVEYDEAGVAIPRARPNVEERLYDFPMMPAGAPPVSVVSEPFRSFRTEGVVRPPWKQPGLAQLFAPPLDLLHTGSFEDACKHAEREVKWLLVDLHTLGTFACQVLNRDVWKDVDLKPLIRKNFVFWQKDGASEDGHRYKVVYQPSRTPHVAIIDPVTKMKMHELTGDLTIQNVRSQLNTFLREHPYPTVIDANGQRKPHHAATSTVKSSLSMTDDEAMQAAIAASLVEAHDDEIGSKNDELLVSSDDDEAMPAFGSSRSPLRTHGGKAPKTNGSASASVRSSRSLTPANGAGSDDDVVELSSMASRSAVPGNSPARPRRTGVAEASVPKGKRARQDDEPPRADGPGDKVSAPSAKKARTDESASAPQSAPEPVAVPAPVAIEMTDANSTRLQIRLPAGKVVRERFLRASTTQALYGYVADVLGAPAFEVSLFTMFPKKEVASGDRTLEEAGLLNASVVAERLDPEG